MIFTIVISSVMIFLMLIHIVPTSAILFIILTTLFVNIFSNSFKQHNNFLSFDYYAQISKLNKLNVFLKAFLVLSSIIICIGSNSIVICGITILTMFIYTTILGGINIKYYFNLLMLPLKFISLSCLSVVIQFFRNPFGYFDIKIGSVYAVITSNSQLEAIKLCLKASAGVSSLYMLGLTTPLSSIIDCMRKLRLPKVLIELMFLIHRYIFVLYDTQNKMILSSDSRLGNKNFLASINSVKNIARNLIILSFCKISENYNAMESRCYDGDLIFITEPSPFKLIDFLQYTIFLLLIFILWIIGI